MISLGGITLNPDMIWREQFQSQRVVQSVRPTLGGVPVVFSASIDKGTPITLAAAEVNSGPPAGVLRKSVVDAVMALADIAGAVYTLSFHGTDYSVIFRHEDPPAVAMAPLVTRTSYDDADLMVGEIKLLTV